MPAQVREHLALECRQVSQWFGDPAQRHPILYEINCEIVRGQTVACVGPSGCGKTTLLKAILGTQLAKSGQILVHRAAGDTRIVSRPGLDRGIVFQDNSLFPFLTALGNVCYGLKLRDLSLVDQFCRPWRWFPERRRQRELARALLAEFGLESACNKYPYQLSGGMQRRVAIAQAMIMQPEILLLDEPFTGLDERSIEILIQLLLRINVQAKKTAGPYSGTTLIIVTHELNSGIAVSDRVIGISQNWDWQKDHQSFPGATIVYDRPAPVYLPDMPIHYADFAAQREEIFRVVYNPKTQLSRDQFITFWKEVRGPAGSQGVLQ